MNEKIDLSKYEGHTKGPWAWERGALNVLHVKDSEPMHTLLHDEKKDVDARLIADAPLLLEEVERLRYIVDSIPDEVWKDMKTWEAMKGVIE
jgi:hypothetical protein